MVDNQYACTVQFEITWAEMDWQADGLDVGALLYWLDTDELLEENEVEYGDKRFVNMKEEMKYLTFKQFPHIHPRKLS